MPSKQKIPPYFAALAQAQRSGQAPAFEAPRLPWLQFRVPSSYSFGRVELPIDALPPGLVGLRIIHLSDLHLRPFWGRPYDQLIADLRENPPDLILITGDFIDNKTDHRPALKTVRRLVPNLISRLGTFAILGNHDPDVMTPYLIDMRVTLVGHRRLLVHAGRHGEDIELIGLPGHSRGDLDPHFVRGQPPRRPGLPRIVLSHYPDLYRQTRILEPDIYLAGHTHGGQICLPNGLALLSHDSMPRRFKKGIHRVEHTWFIVSNGFGFTGLPFRLFCPAEVRELTLVKSTELRHTELRDLLRDLP